MSLLLGSTFCYFLVSFGMVVGMTLRRQTKAQGTKTLKVGDAQSWGATIAQAPLLVL